MKNDEAEGRNAETSKRRAFVAFILIARHCTLLASKTRLETLLIESRVPKRYVFVEETQIDPGSFLSLLLFFLSLIVGWSCCHCI